MSQHGVGTIARHTAQRDEVPGEALGRVDESRPRVRIPRMALIPAGHEIDHQQAALGDGDVQVGRLPDHGGVDVAHRRHGRGHRCVVDAL